MAARAGRVPLPLGGKRPCLCQHPLARWLHRWHRGRCPICPCPVAVPARAGTATGHGQHEEAGS